MDSRLATMSVATFSSEKAQDNTAMSNVRHKTQIYRCLFCRLLDCDYCNYTARLTFSRKVRAVILARALVTAANTIIDLSC